MPTFWDVFMGGRQVSRKSTRKKILCGKTHTLALLQLVRQRERDEKLTPVCQKILNLRLSHVGFSLQAVCAFQTSQAVYPFQNVLQVFFINWLVKFSDKYPGVVNLTTFDEVLKKD